MRLLYVLLGIVLCQGCFNVHGDTGQMVDSGAELEKIDIPLFYGLLSEWDRAFVAELREQFKSQNDNKNDLIIKKIYALRDEFAAPDTPAQPMVDDYFSVGYALMETFIGRDYIINKALQALAETLIVSGSLKTAVGYANMCRYSSFGQDELWPYFIPAVLNRYKEKHGHPRGLSQAVYFLHRYIEDIKNHPAFTDFWAMQQPVYLARCWGIAIDKMLLEDAASFEEHDLKDIFEQIRVLIDHTRTGLYQQCSEAFSEYQVTAEVEIRESFEAGSFFYFLGGEKPLGGFSVYARSLYATTKSAAELYDYTKAALLCEIANAITFLEKHIPKIFEDRPLVARKKIEILQHTLQSIKNDVEEQQLALPKTGQILQGPGNYEYLIRSNSLGKIPDLKQVGNVNAGQSLGCASQSTGC